MRRFLPHLKAGAVLAVYWLILFVCTHIPRLNLNDLEIHSRDVTLHGFAYLLLTLLCWWALYGKKIPSLRRPQVYVTLGLVAVYGVVDELTQQLVHRTADIRDWTADMIGCVAALVLLYCLRKPWHWLAAYWLCLAAFLHIPQKFPQLQMLGDCWRPFQPALMAAAFLALTLLLWRSLSAPGRFDLNKRILLLVPAITVFYALLDQGVQLYSHRLFDIRDFLGCLAGILGGMFCAAAWACQNRPAG